MMPLATMSITGMDAEKALARLNDFLLGARECDRRPSTVRTINGHSTLTAYCQRTPSDRVRVWS